MDNLLLILATLAVGLVLAALLSRRADAHVREQSLSERSRAVERGSHRARLQYPSIDLTNCIGCGACVRACPEDGVLQLAYGQAVVVHGARCVGHGLCADACPTAAIALTLGDLSTRRDLPAVDESNEAIGNPGLFLAGEITGFALVRTAVAHGAMVARAVHARRQDADPADHEVVDLVVIGTGPAGVSCLLAAKELGLRAIGLDQAEVIGGTVAAYPRKKMVMTQAIELPLHGRLPRLEYTKEQLVELWQELAARHELDVRLQTTVERIDRISAGTSDDTFVVVAGDRSFRTHSVCLSVGRRGTPRKLNVPGEELNKVAYSLLDAQGYRNRRVLVVGGGDSAIEAALALAEQPGNEVVLSYRRAHFSRLKAKNEQRIQAAIEDGLVIARFETVVERITTDSVTLSSHAPAAAPDSQVTTVTTEQLANDDVFVFAGGTPPFPLLESAGVSFDATMLRAGDAQVDRGNGLLMALLFTLMGALSLLAIRHWFGAYYDLRVAARPSSGLHPLLRPQGLLGLVAGLSATLLFVANLSYLVRRSPRAGRWLPGSLRAWMNTHVATGLGACLFAVLHSSFSLRSSAGGHALLTMLVVVAAGVVGRWFYAFVPRAQNGRQERIEELAQRVTAIAAEWDRDGRGVGDDARRMVEELVERADIGQSFPGRILGLVRSQWRLRRQLDRFSASARARGVPAHDVARMVSLSKRSFRLALQLAHYDDLRALLSTWRWMHRWLALLLAALLVVHVVTAVRYGGIDLSPWLSGGAK